MEGPSVGGRCDVDVRCRRGRRGSSGTGHDRRQLRAVRRSSCVTAAVLSPAAVPRGPAAVIVIIIIIIIIYAPVLRPLQTRGGADASNSPVLPVRRQRHEHEVGGGRDSGHPADRGPSAGPRADAGQLAWTGVSRATRP